MKFLFILALLLPAAYGLECYSCEGTNCTSDSPPKMRTCIEGDNACYSRKRKSDNVLISKGCADAKDTGIECFKANDIQVCIDVCKTNACNHGHTIRCNILIFILLLTISLIFRRNFS